MTTTYTEQYTEPEVSHDLSAPGAVGSDTDVPAASPRRAEARRDRSAQRADDRADRSHERAERRRDREHKRQLKEQKRDARHARKVQRRADKEKRVARRRKERRTTWRTRSGALQTRLAAHMPLWGLPVVAVSLIMGWSGQAQAAAHLGMGWAAVGVPVLTEGMTLTFAGLTGQAIDQRRPYRWLLRATWATAVVAAAVNASGHLVEDDTPAGMYRAAAYAAASLAGVVLWAVVMRSRRSVVSGKTAEEIARWKRLRRRHPILVRRARHIADNTGISLSRAYEQAWSRASGGAAPGDPSIREIRAARRNRYRRMLAESWDGRRHLWFIRDAPLPEGRAERLLPAERAVLTGGAEQSTSPETCTRNVPTALQTGLYLPTAPAGFEFYPVPVPPARTSGSESGKTAGEASRKGDGGEDPRKGIQKGSRRARKKAAQREGVTRRATTRRIGAAGRTRRTALSDEELDEQVRALDPPPGRALSARYVARALGCDQGRAKESLVRTGRVREQG
ncbi:hypothetical protein ABZ569_32340 [Streptomyces albus]|uniref:hypothetical protein n=1 Tax=Streptomyces albus TaxID=1888 RepID=UPI0033D2BA5E